MSKVIFYTLPTDAGKCKTYCNGAANAYAFQLKLLPFGQFNYFSQKDGRSRSLVKLTLSPGDLAHIEKIMRNKEPVESFVWMGHGVSGGLSGADAPAAAGFDDSFINLDAVAALINALDPRIVTFACCLFGNEYGGTIIEKCRVNNGPEYIASRLKTLGKRTKVVINASITPATFPTEMDIFAPDLLDVHYLFDPAGESISAIKSYEVRKMLG